MTKFGLSQVFVEVLQDFSYMKSPCHKGDFIMILFSDLEELTNNGFVRVAVFA